MVLQKRHIRRGRPTVAERPNTVTVSIRHVNTEAIRRLRVAAADKNITIGEILSEVVLNSLKQ